MGEVYRARDPVLKRFVAIKVISANLVSDEQFRRRFLQEARSAAQLNHRNITTVFEFNEEPGQVFLVMEFLEGSDLREAISRRTVQRIEDKLGIIEQVCDGLAYAHSKGIIHRDLKPANVRILPNLTPKIMDFGLARLGTSEITRAGTVMGTPDYMSPEQVRAEKVDARADVFSVGAVLYHLLSARKPFEAPSVHSILYEVLERDPPKLTDLVPDLPPLVVPIVERALRKDPAKRFQNAAAMRDALRDARRALAAGRAAAAALMPGSESEATITRLDGLTPTYPSVLPPTAASLSVRPAANPPSVSTGSGSASPPTLAMTPGTLIEGATALELPPAEEGEASTERPEATFVAPPSPTSVGRYLVAGGALLSLLLLGGGVWWWYSAQQTERQRRYLTYTLAEQQLDTARTELESRAYEKAIVEAQAVLASDSGNIDAEQGARDVIERARAAQAALETAARETREAYEKGDLKASSDALTRVLVLDPRHPIAVELGPALKSQFSSRAEKARAEAQGARRSAEAAKATGLPAFAEADRLVVRADAQAQAGEYVEATNMFGQAAAAFERARRETLMALAAARAAEENAAAEQRARVAQAQSARQTTLPAPSSARPSAATGPSISPATTTSGQISPPPVSPPILVPSGPPPAPSAAPGSSGAPAVALSAAEPAVQSALATYVRAMNGGDIALFKTVKPNTTRSEAEGLQASFKRVKLQINLTVNRVVVEQSGGRAQAFTTRKDVVAGQEMKPKPQIFTLVPQGTTWVIESFEFPK
jgi:serine/threonine protein kinase